MSTETSTSSYGGVRWRRFAAIFTVATSMAVALITLTAQGVLAAQFSISGMPFTVTSTQLSGTGFEQFAVLDTMAPGSPNEGDTGGQLVLIVSAINEAELQDLCQSINLGGTNLRLTAGAPGRPVRARTLVVDSDLIQGDAAFNNISIGQDASTLDRVPGVTGPIGVFGQQAENVTIKNLRQNNFATTAASFTLPNLSMGFASEGC